MIKIIINKPMTIGLSEQVDIVNTLDYIRTNVSTVELINSVDELDEIEVTDKHKVVKPYYRMKERY